MPAIPEAGLQEMLGYAYDASVIADVNANSQFITFHGALEGGPHGAVHAGIGGSAGDMGPLTSPNGSSRSYIFHLPYITEAK